MLGASVVLEGWEMHKWYKDSLCDHVVLISSPAPDCSHWPQKYRQASDTGAACLSPHGWVDVKFKWKYFWKFKNFALVEMIERVSDSTPEWFRINLEYFDKRHELMGQFLLKFKLNFRIIASQVPYERDRKNSVDKWLIHMGSYSLHSSTLSI